MDAATPHRPPRERDAHRRAAAPGDAEGEGAPSLAEIVARELGSGGGAGAPGARPEDAGPGPAGREPRDEVDVAAAAIVDAIRARHGASVAAVLFYGSCLRRRTPEGVLDFYAVVDSYRAAHGSRIAAAANAALPPTVLWLELEHPRLGTLRSKYAVTSLGDFARGCSRRSLDGRLWARFAQPAAFVWVRDAGARDAIVAAVAEAPRTFVARMLPLMPGEGAVRRFRAGELWRRGLRETYAAELRSESAETIEGIAARDPERSRRVTLAALRSLRDAGDLVRVDVETDAETGAPVFVAAHASAGAAGRGRRAWSLRRRLQKAIGAAALLKTAFTQDDWVTYVLWKLERHTGQRIAVSDAQRRHPLLLGWPVILRLLRQGILR